MRAMTCLAFMSVAVAMATATFGAAVIDQQNPDTNATGWDGFDNARWNAQNFEPTLPYLTGVEFYGLPASHPWNTYPDGQPEVAKVFATSGGLPTTLLGTATRTSPLGENNWNGPFNFPSPIDVSPYVGVGAGSLFVA